MTQDEFLTDAIVRARDGGHIFPEYAACEAAEESGFGSSGLAEHANNLFGEKVGAATRGKYPTIQLPSWEIINGQRVNTVGPDAPFWPVFPDWSTSFRERMALLQRLAPSIPHYAAALAATDGETFVGLMGPCPNPRNCRFTGEPCETWATDPKRTANVLGILNDHRATVFPTEV